MFRKLELIRQYCVGGLSVLPETGGTEFQRGQRAGLEMVRDYIELEQERMIKEAMDEDDRFLQASNDLR